MRRQVLIVTALVIAINAAAANLVAHQSPQRVASNPNVVLIIMDDMGYGEIGSYGVSDARTPNLDRLAREGVRLTESYANGANCTPTRVTLISGRYQQRVGLEWALNSTEQDRGLPVSGGSLRRWLK
jgi:arylsulfatase A